MLFATLNLAVAVPPSAPAPADHLAIDTLFDFVTKGGPAMIAIGLCSILAFTIVIERLIVLRKGRVAPAGFLDRIRASANDRAKALDLARRNRSPIAKILEVAIRRADEPQELLEKHVEEAGGREIVSLRQRMRLLSALPQVSTMLGLLGTVFGMIKTFQAVSASSEALGKTEMLAEGIFEAWTCTAAGLLVAIPVMLAYHYLMGRIDSMVVMIDEIVVNFLERQKAARTSSPEPDAEIRPVSPYRSVEESLASI